MILDWLLPKETKNLSKINKIAEKFNIVMQTKPLDLAELVFLECEFKRIETKEHKDKINLYLEMISSLLIV